MAGRPPPRACTDSDRAARSSRPRNRRSLRRLVGTTRLRSTRPPRPRRTPERPVLRNRTHPWRTGLGCRRAPRPAGRSARPRIEVPGGRLRRCGSRPAVRPGRCHRDRPPRPTGTRGHPPPGQRRNRAAPAGRNRGDGTGPRGRPGRTRRARGRCGSGGRVGPVVPVRTRRRCPSRRIRGRKCRLDNTDSPRRPRSRRRRRMQS